MIADAPVFDSALSVMQGVNRDGGVKRSTTVWCYEYSETAWIAICRRKKGEQKGSQETLCPRSLHVNARYAITSELVVRMLLMEAQAAGLTRSSLASSTKSFARL